MELGQQGLTRGGGPGVDLADGGEKVRGNQGTGGQKT